MIVKSWHFALLSFIIELLFIIGILILNPPLAIVESSFGLAVLIIMLIGALIMPLIIAGLLYFNKTIKIGAIISIVFGLYLIKTSVQWSLILYNSSLVVSSNFKEANIAFLVFSIASIISGILIVLAGIFYFLKEKNKLISN